MTTPTVDAQSELIDRLEAEVIRVGAERDAAIRAQDAARQGIIGLEAQVLRARADYYAERARCWEMIAEMEVCLAEVRPDAARLDLLESRLVRAVWVECGRGRLFRLTTTDGRCFEGTTARGAIDAAMADIPATAKGVDHDDR